MSRIENRLREHYDASFSYSEDVILNIVARSQEVDTGARNIENILTRTMLPEIAMECLSRLANNMDISAIQADVDESGKFSYQVS